MKSKTRAAAALLFCLINFVPAAYTGAHASAVLLPATTVSGTGGAPGIHSNSGTSY